MRISYLALAAVALAAYSPAGFAADPAGVPTSVMPTSVPTSPPPAPAVVEPPSINATLNDGTKIEIDADNTVWVLGADKSKTPAPDGTLTLRDGTPFVVKDGKRVAGE